MAEDGKETEIIGLWLQNPEPGLVVRFLYSLFSRGGVPLHFIPRLPLWLDSEGFIKIQQHTLAVITLAKREIEIGKLIKI